MKDRVNDNKYIDERNAQIVILLLKSHGIKKVVASPGTTNISFLASVQNDPFFEVVSAPDERSAAYIACGMAQASGEAVVLNCTGATSSRNYYPGLTEAFYSKLPLVVVTSSRRSDRIGHNFDQVTDRLKPAGDIVKCSVNVPVIHDKEDEWACEVAVNKAILELYHHDKGPVHINLETIYSTNTIYGEMPPTRVIYRYGIKDKCPEIEAKRVAIMVGAHNRWSQELTSIVDQFCEHYNGIVLCDQISNYHGRYSIFPNLMSFQEKNDFEYRKVDLLISIGEITSSDYGIITDTVWRVNKDGALKDTFWHLKKIFEMEEIDFFSKYCQSSGLDKNTEFYKKCKAEEQALYKKFPEIPFSNVWIASITAEKIPADAVLHLGIRNSLRSFNYFYMNDEVTCYANTGGFGIDGSLSTAIGISLCEKGKKCFAVLGDLAFFYDINSLGNRHIGNNLRILMINNGTGMEMKFTGYLADLVGVDADSYIAASGHYGSKSRMLVKNYVEELGFEYISASNKEQYIAGMQIFLDANDREKPIVFEAFVSESDENEAWIMLHNIL